MMKNLEKVCAEEKNEKELRALQLVVHAKEVVLFPRVWQVWLLHMLVSTKGWVYLEGERQREAVSLPN